MQWLNDLIFGSGIAHAVFVLSLVVSGGILLGKIKVFGISLGITWILFVGIFFGHFGLTIDEHVLHFVKEFGLILFIYSIGMQVGPSFFSSFKQGGITLNLLATAIVFLGVITAYVLHLITGLPISTMVGILSGTVTNTPGLGAAQQTFRETMGADDPSIAMGYALAYPLGVVGIILTLILMKTLFKVNYEKELSDIESHNTSKLTEAQLFSLQVKNPSVFGKNIKEIKRLLDKDFVISRVQHTETGRLEIAQPTSVLNQDDKILVVSNLQNIDILATLIGAQIDMSQKEWMKLDAQLISRRISVTKSEINGKTIGQLKLRNLYGVNITRVNRAGIDLVGEPHLQLQIGDRVTVVGSDSAVANVEKLLGNSLKRLREPNLIAIFIEIALGVLLGSIPFVIPGIPQPVKLGLAGGPAYRIHYCQQIRTQIQVGNLHDDERQPDASRNRHRFVSRVRGLERRR